MNDRSLRDELGLSRDQYYRRVRALVDARLIDPDRGRDNAIILSDDDSEVLRRFCAIEQNHSKRPLAWHIERLRGELLADQLMDERIRREKAEGSLRLKETEVRQVRMALAKRQRVRRFWKRVLSWFLPKRDQAED